MVVGHRLADARSRSIGLMKIGENYTLVPQDQNHRPLFNGSSYFRCKYVAVPSGLIFCWRGNRSIESPSSFCGLDHEAIASGLCKYRK